MNNIRKIREQKLISKAELARRSGLSVLTIDRVERGKSCRMDTMRKIILGLGLSLEDKDLVLGTVGDEPSASKESDRAAQDTTHG